MTPSVEQERVAQESAPQTIQAVAQTFAAPTPAAPCAAAHPGESAEVTIGAILPLSSPGALLAGFAMQTALNIAVTDLNERGGIQETPVRLVTYDSAGTPERAAQFAERLILLDCASAIVGLYHNGATMAATDVAHRFGTPVIVAEAGADDITARGYPEVFRLAPAHSMIAQFPAAWLREIGDYNADGVVAATIVADNASSGALIMDKMAANLEASGISVDILHVDLPSTDFSSSIARLVTHERLPDAIFITIKGEPALLLQAQILDAGIGPQRNTLIVQHHAGLNSAQFWHEVPTGNGTVVARMGAWPSTLSEQGQDFAIKYDQYMGRWPESYAFAAYDSVSLVAAAMESAASWQGDDLIATLELIHAQVASGEISFAVTRASAADPSVEDHQPPYLWHQWQNSQMLYLQYTETNQPAAAMTVVWPPDYRTPSQQTAIVPATP